MQIKDEKGRFIRHLKNKTCSFCKLNFKPKLAKSKFCSKPCYDKNKKGQKQDPEVVTKRAIANTGRRTGKFLACFFCQKQKYFYPRILKIRTRVFCTPNCFKQWSKTSDNPNWKGHDYPENRRLRDSARYKNWRKQVQLRDNFKCVECGYKSKRTKPPDIQVDHIKSWALYPELRFELSNGRVLCRNCHKKTDTWGVNAKFYEKV